jgi:hypothetical protein
MHQDVGEDGIENIEPPPFCIGFSLSVFFLYMVLQPTLSFSYPSIGARIPRVYLYPDVQSDAKEPEIACWS